MNPSIVAISGPLKGQRFWIDESDLVIGRGRSCGILVDDSTLSARHCSVCCAFDNESVLLLDLRSRSGTFVNGFCFPAKILVDGDRIRVGRSTFVYRENDEAMEVDPGLLTLT